MIHYKSVSPPKTPPPSGEDENNRPISYGRETGAIPVGNGSWHHGQAGRRRANPAMRASLVYQMVPHWPISARSVRRGDTSYVQDTNICCCQPYSVTQIPSVHNRNNPPTNHSTRSAPQRVEETHRCPRVSRLQPITRAVTGSKNSGRPLRAWRWTKAPTT